MDHVGSSLVIILKSEEDEVGRKNGDVDQWYGHHREDEIGHRIEEVGPLIECGPHHENETGQWIGGVGP